MAGYDSLKRDIRWWHVIALCIIITGVLLTVWTAQQQDQQLRNELLVKANIAAVDIDPAMVESLHGSPEDISSSDYQHLKAQLAQIRVADPSTRFAYLMGQRPEGIFFYVDSEPADSEGYSPPGQLYPEATVLLNAAFSDKMPMTEGPISDSYGTWVSAIVPVTDQETGELVALMGVDVDARYWNYSIARAFSTIIIASLLLLVLVLAFGLIQRRNQREQRRLAASEEKHRVLIENSHDIIYTINTEGLFTFVSPAWTVLLGDPVSGVVGHPFQPFVHPDDLPGWMAWLQKVIETGQRQEGVEYRVRHIDGSWYWHTSSAVPLRDKAGTIIGLEGTARDITDRKRAEEKTRESEQNFKGIFDVARDGILIADLKAQRFVMANPAIQMMTGYTEAELLNLGVFEFHPQQDLPYMREQFKKQEMGEISLAPECPVLRKDGTVFYCDINASIFLRNGSKYMLGVFRDITERKQAETVLRESEEQSRTINNSILFGIMIVDAMTHVIIDVNDKALEIIGAGRDMVVGSVCHRFVCPAEPGKCPVTDLGQMVNCSDRILLNLRGERIPIFKSVVRTTLKGKDVLIESFIDITERKLADELVRVLARMSDDAPASITVHDFEGHNVYANEETLRLHGYTREEYLAKDLHEIDVPENEQLIAEHMDHILSTGEGDFEAEHFRKDGTRFPLHVKVKIIDWGGKKMLMSIATDITERKQAQEALRISEERYRGVVDDQTEFICRFLPDGTHVFVNYAYCNYFGLSPDTIIGARFQPLLYPDDRERVARLIASLKPDHPMESIDHRTIMPDGSTRWQRWNDHALFDENGRIVEYQSVGRDITDMKEIEFALRDSERTIYNLLNAVPDDLALINFERKIIAVNASMAEAIGQAPEALAGMAIGDFLTSSVLSDSLDRVTDPAMTGGQVYFEEKRDDRWLETSVYPVTDRSGTDIRIAIQSHDITTWKHLEAELKTVGLSQVELNIQKFQVLNDQIRNPLQIISGYMSFVDTGYNDIINKQVLIIDNLVTQLDMGWLESEKVQQFLMKHSHYAPRTRTGPPKEDGLQ